jgi:hypothetical protein
MSGKIDWPHLKLPQEQEIAFDNGERRVIKRITHIENGKWCHMICEDGRGDYEIIVNPSRVLFVRIKKL